MNDAQWIQWSEADGDRERAALDWLRTQLPDYAVRRAWNKFQFLALNGHYFQVDSLVFSSVGIFLVQFANQRGSLEIGAQTWKHTPAHGRPQVLDNPLSLARTKTELLHELLGHRLTGNYKVPAIQPLVFVTQQELEVQVAPDAANAIFFHPHHANLPSILDALIDARGPGIRALSDRLAHDVFRRFEELVEDADFEKIPQRQKLGDYQLGKLLDTTQLYQDYQARHVNGLETVRARIFRVPRGVGDEQRERIRDAARREYDIVSSLEHPSILAARRHIGSQSNPAVIFEHPTGAVRLDHYLQQAGSLSANTRFKLLESIAEAVQYAHENGVLHRALCPQSVLVLPTDDGSPPQIRLYNWHTGQQNERKTGTRHLGDYLHDTSHFFLAPEAGEAMRMNETADIFGLGALTYFLFTGKPPARDPSEYYLTISRHGGLRLSAARDAVSPELDDLVWKSTRARPADRLHSVYAFLEQLQRARQSLIAVDSRGLIDPIDAEPGTLIADRYQVVRRLGTGSTATAFLAVRDGRHCVLKVANDHAHATRLLAEAEALKKITHPLIVNLLDVLQAGERTMLVLQYAGQTFSDRLLKTRALSLDDQHRFGSDLCEICVALEAQRIFHRDIKPANLGIGDTASSRQRMMLFDFSLAGVPIEAVDTGTPAYRDPFVGARRHWDTYADRYSAALVLYEMLTQQRPQWGDGQTAPAVDPDARLILASERFPASIRNALVDFFTRAFARQIEDRFDNAVEMAAMWRDIFESTLHSEHDSDELASRLRQANGDTELASLGLSQVVRSAFDAAGMTTVADLLRAPANTFQFALGISGPVRNDISELRNNLAALLPSLDYHTEHTPLAAEPGDYAEKSIDHLLEYILGKRGGALRQGLGTLMAELLAHDDPAQALAWSPQRVVAERIGLQPQQFDLEFSELSRAWLRKRAVGPLRDDIVTLIDMAGGMLSARELSQDLLVRRGSTRPPETRMAAAAAVTRAGVEAELADAHPRLAIRRHADTTFVATRPELLDLLQPLGDLADQFALRDSLASPSDAFAAINDLFQRAGLDHRAPTRRALALAVAASHSAALSQQDEIYPRGMSPLRTLTLCANILLMRAPLSHPQLVDLAHARYPLAERLPAQPALSQLLSDARIALRWDPAANDSHGAYVYANEGHSHAVAIIRSTEADTLFASSTTYPPGHSAQRDDERFEEHLAFKSRHGGFLALTIRPRDACAAPEILAERYDLKIVSVEALFLRHLRHHAQRIGVDWQTLLRADGPGASDLDRSRFALFLRGLVPAMKEELEHMQGRLLLIHPGLLARWQDIADTMSLLSALRNRAHPDLDAPPDPARAHNLTWLLIAGDDQHKRPRIDHTPVPVIDDSEYLKIPSGWVTTVQQHRAAPLV